MPSYLVQMIALAYRKEESEVIPMLVAWKAEPATYEAIATRLAQHDPPVSASPQRLAELILAGQGDQRPPVRAPRQERPA